MFRLVLRAAQLPVIVYLALEGESKLLIMIIDVLKLSSCVFIKSVDSYW